VLDENLRFERLPMSLNVLCVCFFSTDSIQQTKERSRDERKELQKAYDEVVARELVLQGEVRRLEKELQASLLPAKSITLQRGYSGSGVHTRRYLDKSITKFQHPDPRLNQQLVSLQDRHLKLSKLLSKDPNNLHHLELLGKIEKVILDIVASGKKPK
jgi:predicted  nucleic acid-binding Zn-ribbon protein